jgi:hypothetical protein
MKCAGISLSFWQIHNQLVQSVDDYQSSHFKIKSRNKTKLVQRSSAFPLQIRKKMNSLMNPGAENQKL